MQRSMRLQLLQLKHLFLRWLHEAHLVEPAMQGASLAEVICRGTRSGVAAGELNALGARLAACHGQLAQLGWSPTAEPHILLPHSDASQTVKCQLRSSGARLMIDCFEK